MNISKWQEVPFRCSGCNKAYTYNSADILSGATGYDKEVCCPQENCGKFQHFEKEHQKWAEEALKSM